MCVKKHVTQPLMTPDIQRIHGDAALRSGKRRLRSAHACGMPGKPVQNLCISRRQRKGTLVFTVRTREVQADVQKQAKSQVGFA
jgi:hypothetical protein